MVLKDWPFCKTILVGLAELSYKCLGSFPVEYCLICTLDCA